MMRMYSTDPDGKGSGYKSLGDRYWCWMEAEGYDGPCNVRVRVGSQDKIVTEYTGDFCKISNLYIHNKEMTWD